MHFFGRSAFFLVSGGGLWQGFHGFSGAKRRGFFRGILVNFYKNHGKVVEKVVKTQKYGKYVVKKVVKRW